MKDQEPSDAEFYELLARAVTALETIAKGFEEPTRCIHPVDARMVVDHDPGNEDGVYCSVCSIRLGPLPIVEEPPTEPCPATGREHEYKGGVSGNCIRCGKPYEPPAALTRSEEEILRDPRPGKGVIVTEGYTPPPAEEPVRCPKCDREITPIIGGSRDQYRTCPECGRTWDVDE